MNKFKKICFGVLAIISMAALVGCSSKDSSSSEDSKVKTIKIAWRYTGESDSMSKLLTKTWISNFEKENPNIKIELTPIKSSEGDYSSKLQLQMQSSDTAPDIVNEDSFILPSDAKAGYLLPLDSYLKKWDQWDQYTEALKKGGQGSDGKQYGLPGTTDSRGIWTSKAVLEKAGLSADWSPKSWDDLVNAAVKIKDTQPDVIPFAMGVSKTNGESVSMQTFEQLLYGTGESLYSEETNKWNVGSEGIEKSLDFINTIMNKEKVGPSLSVAMNSNYGSVIFQDKLPTNKAGIAMDGIWNTGNWTEGGAHPLDDVTEVLNFSPMPTENGQDPGYVTMSGGWTWAITKKSKNHDAAWKVIKAMGTKEMCVKRALVEGTLAVRDDAAQDSKYLNKPYVKVATAALQNAYFRPKSELYPKVSLAIQDMVEAVASDTKTPKEASAEYTTAVQKIVGSKNTETQK